MNLINDVITDADMAERIIATVQAVHKCEYQQALGVYLNEYQFFESIFTSNNNLVGTTIESKRAVFLDVLQNGMSFSPILNHIYLKQQNVKVSRNPDVYQSRMIWDASPDGDIYRCQAAGSIQFLTTPQLVYAGDKYQEYTHQGRLVINHARLNLSNQIISCFVHVVLPDGSREGYSMTVAEDIARLMGYSGRQNKGNANALYTSNNGQIDKGFFFGKIKKHALKGYRKKPIVGSAFIETENE